MQKDLIKDLYYSDYVSENGLGLLSPRGRENDNGILFLGYQLSKFRKAKCIDERDVENAFKACESTCVKINGIKIEGLHWRSPSNGLLEAHDNLVGISGISAMLGFDYARKIAERGNRYGWSYHSLIPEKQEIRTTLQGGTICFIKMCTGFIPYPIEYLWMLFGILSAGFFGNPSTVNINWYACEVLDFVFETKFNKTHWTYPLYPLVKFIFKLSVQKRYGGIKGSYAKYFIPEHPIHLILEHTNEKYSV